MAFLSSHIVAYKSYLEKDDGGYMGMQSLTESKEFGFFLETTEI